MKRHLELLQQRRNLRRHRTLIPDSRFCERCVVVVIGSTFECFTGRRGCSALFEAALGVVTVVSTF